MRLPGAACANEAPSKAVARRDGRSHKRSGGTSTRPFAPVSVEPSVGAIGVGHPVGLDPHAVHWGDDDHSASGWRLSRTLRAGWAERLRCARCKAAVPRHTLQVSPVVRANSSPLASGHQALNRIGLTSRQRAFELATRAGHVPERPSAPVPARRAPRPGARWSYEKTGTWTIRADS